MADLFRGAIKRRSQWSAPTSWKAPVWSRFIVTIASFTLAGCNANEEANLSSRTARGPDYYNPYDPISYAQNNTGNRGGGH
jgi:hypothetical protein